ncbi:hypothetical protein [Natrialba sp. PRR66]|uniref:hypothetical protein n=1 Tax=Natrialba sp. PRR66 TaxID=3098146 RepID=UPI002B1D8CE9|nr:hypothetical protein [Natrialba sp. PRR66]
MEFSKSYTVAVVTALVLVTISVAGFAGVAAAQNDEIENRTVETSNETEYVEADIVFANSFENTSSETAELTVYDASEFNQSGASATPVLEDSWTVDPNATVTDQYNLNSTVFSSGSEYRAILTVGNENNVDSAYVAADDESIGGGWFDGGLDGSPGFGAFAAISAIGVALATRLRAGGA